ncbi:MAG: 6,7-dimethyl-8-ribityllumazine synthase [Flavisolibacter sp.]
MADVANSKLFQNIEGIRQLKDALVVLVKTEWNGEIIDEMEMGCKKVLQQYNIQSKTITVPGAIEIPFAIRQCSYNSNKVSAYVALGCVIRGGTPHFEYVCQSVTNGITQLNLILDVPVIFGVLTVDSIEQAHERLGGSHGHKGEEAGFTALKMMLLNKELKEGKCLK